MLWVLMTTFNRKDKTIACIESIKKAYSEDFIVVDADAGSDDGTKEALKKCGMETHILRCNREIFWNGGMRASMSYASIHAAEEDMILLVNDDVVFFPDAIDKLYGRLTESGADAAVGAMCDSFGNQTYGGVRMRSKHFARFELIAPVEEYTYCDTFNCNCLLMSKRCMMNAGNLDAAYVHSMGDYDYGMRMKRLGLKVICSSEFTGECEGNDAAGSWMDKSLERKVRLEKKESPKGLPAGDWYHFVKKNYGLIPACYHSATPYIRIMIKK